MTLDKPPLAASLDLLRVKVKINMADMANIFGVSRVAYYKWVKGGGMSRPHTEAVGAFLQKLIRILREQDFPTSAEMRMSSAERAKRLLELMELYD